MMGGGNFVVPAQCVTDFISNRLSGTDIAKTFKVASKHLVSLINLVVCYSYNTSFTTVNNKD